MGKSVITEVAGQKLKLTNLEKTLYNSLNISKAEVIAYYLATSNNVIQHLHGRPLTLIRFPDGVGGKSFYTKNKPSWTPTWMPSGILPWDEDNDYLFVNEASHLIWLANLAALEIHTMNSTISNLANPNQFIVDLDPPEEWDFSDVKSIANKMKAHLEEHGYQPVGKLSGGKGIHITVPIIPNWTYEVVMKGIKSMMKSFISKNKNCTLFVHKDKRKGKMLLDIYRNHPGNTTVAPFSLRGKKGAPVSMPLPWAELMESDNAQMYNLAGAMSYLEKNGNPWSNFDELAVAIHTHTDTILPDRKLKAYQSKRNFNKTNEPDLNPARRHEDVNGRFVIQLHDATNLHFDLRLGQDGVLKSWAIPKGLPIRKGVKRLAIQTEDHPAKYIDFSGTIPKNEYGGGEMWIFDTGTFEWEKKSEKQLKFTLTGKYLKAKYNLYYTKNDQWIVELTSSKFIDPYKSVVSPMLAGVRKSLPKEESDYLYEIKWDGIRVIIFVDGDTVRIQSRSGRDISDQFPEITSINFCRVQHAIFDAELVCLDEKGRPVFSDIIGRMHRTGNIQSATKSKSVYLYIFDCLQIDAKPMIKLPFIKRRDMMRAILKYGNQIRESELFEDGTQLLAAAKANELEGIMVKKKNAKYHFGSRSEAWQKIKFRQTMECIIVGYTEGQGDRANLFGALHLIQEIGDQSNYMGKVGTGFDHKKMTSILDLLKQLEETTKPFPDAIEEENKSTWVEARYCCEIQYASLTNNGTLREPVFLKMWKKD
jgi:DNA ligase D-like protein (predicted ligase)/DNA ligase D-like protein (predicted polymerase)/DNA ligase D-like protein (predicted 3'-phosphoesterase)